MSQTVVNFYKFVELSDLKELQLHLKSEMQRFSILGTILIAPEGINASLSGERDNLFAFVDALQADPRFSDLPVKESVGGTQPFHKIMVRVKRWIIRFAEGNDPTIPEITAGKRMTPAELNKLLTESPDEIVLVDTRNDYEFDYGTFKGAHTLPIRRFTEFPKVFSEAFAEQRDKKFVFFCTGGVRCEKVAPWAEREGFPNSYQLDGGILAYFKEFGGEGYDGNCFVFDERWIVDPNLKEREDMERPPHYPKGAFADR